MVEGAGEDPYLGSAMARAYVRGYQGTRLDAADSIAACAGVPISDNNPLDHNQWISAAPTGFSFFTHPVPSSTIKSKSDASETRLSLN